MMAYNPYLTNPYVQQMIPQAPQQMPAMQLPQQQAGTIMKVDGPNEAMNRFLMRYPANQLVPGFVSDPMFDVNGFQFHTLSVEQDGRRNLETFDYQPHVEQVPAQEVPVSRAEFQELYDKVNELMGASDGIHEPVQAAATATPAGR